MRNTQRYMGNARGSVIAAVAFGIIAMTGAAGMAIDIGRAQLAQSKLSSALDAAGLAAGSSLSTTDLNSEVSKYLNANFRGYMNATIRDIDAHTDDTNSVISLAANGRIDTTFMRYFGIKTMDISATSEITRATSGLELAMVLDNTGSMAGARLTALKGAASDLVTTLFGSGSSHRENDNLFIGVVPFSQAVNIGTNRTGWLASGSLASKNWGTTAWAGCVDARLSNLDVTDTPPSGGMFQPYYWPNDSNNNWITTTTKNGKTTTTYTISATRGPNTYCPQTLVGLSNDKNEILDTIDSMQARGNTHIVEGAAWGWRMLSPRWRGVWGGDMNTNNLPLDYNTPKMNKAVIIMTDGENTIDNGSRGAYWYLSDNRLGSTNQATAVTKLNTKLTQVCTSLKSNNVVVYTIAFGSPGTAIQNLLRSCATQADYYFDSPTSSALHTAFKMIGDSLSNLRVSK